MEVKHCKWYNDEFCTNGDSPCVADYCPVVEYPELCKHREVAEDINVRSKTEEKKLTDDEIVKALECCTASPVGCDECPLIEGDEAHCSWILDVALVLIHRQKAKIKRLTREYERITYNKQEYLEWVDGFLRTHTVMKDRGEDYKMFDREWMCNTFWAKIEGSLDYIIDLETQRNELQTQVDELKEENAQLSEMADYDKGHKEGYEHGAKTTAKEILTDLSEYYYDALDNTDCAARFDFWCRKYDVEVE